MFGDIAGPDRSIPRDRALGAMLAFVAGATNAGGFLAVGHYTSHMTGIVSSIADELALGHYALVATGTAALLTFVAGAMTTAVTVNWARRRNYQSLFALPLLMEAILLVLFGRLGTVMAGATTLVIPLTVVVLCFLMGLQNAVITKVSKAEIRTTHVTGIVTDIGIELGRLVYINRTVGVPRVLADRDRLRVHLTLLTFFLVGGFFGAVGFKTYGYVAAYPLALLLGLIVWRPIVSDIIGASAPGGAA